MFTTGLKSLKVVKEPLDWWQAKSYCEQIGGKLFSELDGSLEQLDNLFSLQNKKSFWLGLRLTGIGKVENYLNNFNKIWFY